MAELPYRRLTVWQKAHALAVNVLRVAAEPSMARHFYFRDQVCAAAMSIPANIAEGNGRGRPLDYASFFDRARGSAFELDSWLLAAADLEYCDRTVQESLSERIQEVTAMLFTLRNRLREQAAADKASCLQPPRLLPFNLPPPPER